ncbi:class I SAM-dependent methyltransferase [Salibacteraceae bacterium]|jgi:ubiquinone/menaquinone biosynthesis C-methylase UbiE|nr:class I SAM-dependent methyltransferase [Salibacteraceae bacterium]
MKKYYTEVGHYYDEDAPQFEDRYWNNLTLQRTRMHFRSEVKNDVYENVLEIGTGPGLDASHFAQWRPESEVYGIDVSQEMCRLSEEKAESKGLKNVHIKQGAVEDLDALFPNETFDCIYVFFGGLNTVEDLTNCVEILTSKLRPGGRFVFTSINRYFLVGFFFDLLRGKVRKAFGRINDSWGGYSTDRQLHSIAYSPKTVYRACKGLSLEKKEGFSILHPAWFHDHLRKKLGRWANVLWRLDRVLNRTVFWSFGELNMYVFRK